MRAAQSLFEVENPMLCNSDFDGYKDEGVLPMRFRTLYTQDRGSRDRDVAELFLVI